MIGINLEEALVAELKSIPALSGRIYPLGAPEAKAGNGVPYLIYRMSEGLFSKSLGGYQSGKTVLGELNIIASRYSDMKEITRAVIQLIISFEQRVIGTNGPFIQEVLYEQPVEQYENQPNLYRCIIDCEFYIS